MFRPATSKLEDARQSLGQLRDWTDAQQFRAAFNSFLGHIRAVTFAMQKEGAHIEGFGDWYTPKQDEMRDDKLLRFIHDARTEDFHEGKNRLNFSTHIKEIIMGADTPPPEGASAMSIGPDGPFWIVDEGQPTERREPFRGGSHEVRVSIKDPPKEHLGKELEQPDPITICSLAQEYMENLLHEAKEKFNPDNEMTDERTEIIEEVKKLLVFHIKKKRNHTVDDTLQRLFAERVKDAPVLKFETMKIREEVWNTDQLEKLDRKHDRIKRLDDEHELRPIVAVQYEDVFYLIDGNNRVNKWIDEKNTKPHKVYILEP